MKKLIFGLIATVMLGIAGNAQSFEESAVLISKGSISKNKMFARLFEIKSFSKSFNIQNAIAINLVDFTDDGKNNDLVARDGIYTSAKLYAKDDLPSEYVFKSDLFKYDEQLKGYLNNNTSSIKIGCKIRHVRTGYSILGIDCAHSIGGCIEFYDCYIELSLGL